MCWAARFPCHLPHNSPQPTAYFPLLPRPARPVSREAPTRGPLPQALNPVVGSDGRQHASDLPRWKAFRTTEPSPSGPRNDDIAAGTISPVATHPSVPALGFFVRKGVSALIVPLLIHPNDGMVFDTSALGH